MNSDGTSVKRTMSGLGPPGVWAAQKRLESWARAARERTSSASSGQSHNSTDSFGDDKSHGSLNVSSKLVEHSLRKYYFGAVSQVHVCLVCVCVYVCVFVIN